MAKHKTELFESFVPWGGKACVKKEVAAIRQLQTKSLICMTYKAHISRNWNSSPYFAEVIDGLSSKFSRKQTFKISKEENLNSLIRVIKGLGERKN